MIAIWLTLFLCLGSPAVAQNSIAQFDTTLTNTTQWFNRTLPDIGQSSFNVDVYDSAGSGSVLVAFSNADTAVASGGLSKYHRIDGGTSFSYANRSSRKIFLKVVSGTAVIRIFIY
jgi:hypothetical protein